MSYICTRTKEKVSSARAILRGLSPAGGLYVPEELPKAALDMLPFGKDTGYAERAAKVLRLFFPDLPGDSLDKIAEESYRRFNTPSVAPVHMLDDQTALLELYHGPTLAFKDLALQVLPRLTLLAAQTLGETREIAILTATSGDTGKAALEGFSDVPGTSCTVFYPLDGVSKLQQKQMVTSAGKNTHVIAVRGNFDDAQTGVKAIFHDTDFAQKLSERNIILSSANSINIGRLVPQVAYYFSAWSDLVNEGRLRPDERLDVCVPTGNFGDILAAWYAKHMGLPLGRLICASNRNQVLTDFIQTGVYDIHRPFHKTISPSMDILISSNLERLVFELLGRDEQALSALMQKLKTDGRYELPAAALSALQAEFSGAFADDNATVSTIRNVWEKHHFLVDPHTAVGLHALALTREKEPVRLTLVNATASPFKFSQDVGAAIGLTPSADALQDAFRLAEAAGLPLPDAIAQLASAPVLHHTVTDIDQMPQAVWDALCR